MYRITNKEKKMDADLEKQINDLELQNARLIGIVNATVQLIDEDMSVVVTDDMRKIANGEKI